jgi:uncharacterized protein DUF418
MTIAVRLSKPKTCASGWLALALHSNSVFARIRVLAPAGRMALTNYLTQAVVSTLFFYGYGAGQWGLARSWQVVFVAVVFALQVAFSHWCWRGFATDRWSGCGGRSRIAGSPGCGCLRRPRCP